MTEVYDSIAYQTILAQAYANIKNVLRSKNSNPLRYMIQIDAGMPVFAARKIHQLRIGYNRFARLSVEASIPHEWLEEESGSDHDEFIRTVGGMVESLNSQLVAANLPI